VVDKVYGARIVLDGWVRVVGAVTEEVGAHGCEFSVVSEMCVPMVLRVDRMLESMKQAK